MNEESQIKTLPPRDFIEFCFNRTVVEKKAWFWTDSNNYHPNPIELASNLIFLFKNLELITSKFSDDEIAQGLGFILTCGSDYFNSLRELGEENIKIHSEVYISFQNVILNIFDLKCIPKISHGSKVSISKLNDLIYMLWDNDCFSNPVFKEEESYIHPYLFKLLEKQICSPNIAVQESAIHGLGHIEFKHPDFAKKTLKRFIKNCNNEELKIYAELAYNGRIQ